MAKKTMPSWLRMALSTVRFLRPKRTANGTGSNDLARRSSQTIHAPAVEADRRESATDSEITHLQSKEPHATSQDRRSSLMDAPVDIVSMIFDLLPLPSQACLALSCKPLYGLFGYILEDEDLAWPTLDTKHYKAPLVAPRPPRDELLLQLEDDRWRYCSGCLKLHPHGLFFPDRTSKCCMYEAGVIDLCSCLSLTFFDRMHIEGWLRAGTTDTLSPRLRQAFQLTVIKGRRHLLHKCSTADGIYASYDLEIMATIGESKHLEVQTRYHVHVADLKPIHLFAIDWRQLSWEKLDPPLLCPHNCMVAFVCGSDRERREHCGLCNTTARILACSESRLSMVVEVVRDLGGVSPMDRQLWNRSIRPALVAISQSWYEKYRGPGMSRHTLKA
ncbi:hypothetical protein BO70DRAFT_220121 [Aspergillus heteromorphus CBS 117.55]|uniref:F-box domain-containing protein n=1 Tax=Aspergillus heteromorphus CBS 117.55 TaxID=1448321 RepID=A0A317WJ15_9EURO|nr:uncharacterized protein BO70DRAFT_220121 [Aspergillus heteromorphus CBS 117.55]PWY86045.1 hypothetical protein BO70DRAFT_220121 [Aspergillus heteromorphus CBS 117.55]